MTQYSSGRRAALFTDPMPWVAWGVRYPSPRGTTYFDPRPEYPVRMLTNRENPALATFREMHGHRKGADMITAAAAWASSLLSMSLAGLYDIREAKHARMVLRRLAALA